jgi:hypothetical protein
MARPNITPEQKRSINFTIRLTPDEQRQLEKVAGICGKTPAVVIRNKVFKGKFPEPKLPKIDLNTYLELKKIGGNLNQLAKMANAGFISKHTDQLLMQLLKQQQTIIKEMLGRDSHSENR